MNNQDDNGQEEKRNIIVNKIKGHFPDAAVVELSKEYAEKHNITGDGIWKVKIEINTVQTSHIIFQPDGSFMMDGNKEFMEILEAGINEAKHYQHNHLKIVKVYLENDGVQIEEVM